MLTEKYALEMIVPSAVKAGQITVNRWTSQAKGT
jgi:hypothetical protein